MERVPGGQRGLSDAKSERQSYRQGGGIKTLRQAEGLLKRAHGALTIRILNDEADNVFAVAGIRPEVAHGRRSVGPAARDRNVERASSLTESRNGGEDSKSEQSDESGHASGLLKCRRILAQGIVQPGEVVERQLFAA